MTLSKHVSLSVLLATGLLALGGCDGTPSVDSGNVEANLTGSVKVDGVPVKDGELTFDASNSGRSGGIKTAPVKDGTYSVKTLTGSNTIKLTGKIAKGKPMLQQQRRSFEVKSGDNTFDMEFSSK